MTIHYTPKPWPKGEHRHSVPFDEWYQSPQWACDLMVSMLPKGVKTVFEPTPGKGRLVKTLQAKGYEVVTYERFEDSDPFLRVDAVVMNPPFKKSIEHKFLMDAMRLAPVIIALLPWFTLINSDSRTKELMEWGLKSVTHLPRRTFPRIRVQPCIIYMEEGYRGTVELHFAKDK